ncbi:curlin [Chelativorans sp. ZYF759]|uniref:curlin n=1 Tax=Chelativorans sp. ZYF759 TaxID=2692213 RepID=UPI00145E01AD|nr:curlin [Chelativorans sp. ZYF759]NMG39122.1 curlin [Chelativorans sp. ZYF759]
MNRKLSAAIAASLIALGAMPALTGAAEASSRGSFSISINPTNAEEERLMRAGLGIYSLVQGVRSASQIRQHGANNSAGIAQHGRNNGAIVHQEGRGHNGTVQQNGNNNRYGLFQFGRGTNGHVVQNGNGGTGATFQFGW